MVQRLTIVQLEVIIGQQPKPPDLMQRFKDSKTLRKPNSTLVMIPRLGRLTAIARKMFNVMLHLTQQQVCELRAAGRTIEATHMFSAKLESIVQPTISGQSDPRTIAKQYLREMRRIEVDWEAPDAATGVIWNSMGLIAQAKLEIINNATWVHWALPPDILLAVSDPDFYTPIDLTYMANLKSYTAIALYEICVRYKNNPKGVTSKNPPAWWVDALTNIPAPRDKETGEIKRREWRKLKSELVLKAIEEINEHTDVEIALYEFKESKAVTAVQFGVQKKKNEAQAATLKIGSDLAAKALALGVPLADVNKLRLEGHTEADLLMGVSRLAARIDRVDLDPLHSRAAYLRRLLTVGEKIEDFQEVLRPKLPHGFTLIDGQGDLLPSEALQRAVPPVEVNQPNERREQRRKEITDELMQLAPSAQQIYVDMATQELAKAGMLVATIARNLAAGDWKRGVILSKVVDCYAREAHGPEWFV